MLHECVSGPTGDKVWGTWRGLTRDGVQQQLPDAAVYVVVFPSREAEGVAERYPCAEYRQGECHVVHDS